METIEFFEEKKRKCEVNKGLDARPKAGKADNKAKKDRLEATNNYSNAYMREGHELGKQGELEAKAAYYNRRKNSRKEQQRLKRLKFKQAREAKNV